MDNMCIYILLNDQNGFFSLKIKIFYGECLKVYMFKYLIFNKF